MTWPEAAIVITLIISVFGILPFALGRAAQSNNWEDEEAYYRINTKARYYKNGVEVEAPIFPGSFVTITEETTEHPSLDDIRKRYKRSGRIRGKRG